MSGFSDQIEEIKSLIYSNCKANKSLAYSTLFYLQEQSSNVPSSIQTLADSSQTLFSVISIDIAYDDEEIAAQALKCLGFMMYHPSLVATIPVDDAKMVLEALARVVMATKIKSVCNLGVWCISMQQFNASILAAQFHILLQAVVHALDNPLGSLSTTFEAIQAVMKLAAQLSEKMRESSHMWAPPIYRRLLSIDKRERDMSERCLLEIRSVIFPPPAALSKALVEDMKCRLLTGMKDLLNQGMKVQAMQAWGWFIRFLGSHAVKNRQLLNDMLKIPEQTFSDHNPQVQITSQVAWEGLVDALIHPSMLTCKTNEAIENGIQHVQTSGGNRCQILASGFSKRIKLIMTPLLGIILSKCDVSVYSSCLNTWCYLLHKLDISINHPSVIELVLEPIFEAVFRIGPDIKTIWLWNLCLDMLDNFLLEKCRSLDHETSSHLSHDSSVRTPTLGPSMFGKCSWKQHPIKWFPWSISQLDFFIKMINIIISHASIATTARENKSSACDAVLRIFRSLLKGVQMEFKSSSTIYNDIMLCLNTILRFIKKICEDVNADVSGNSELLHTSLQFLEAIIEELEPSILGSPLYKVNLDIRYIENLQLINDTRYEKYLHISTIAYMDMVSPLVYLIILDMCMVFISAYSIHRMELILQGLHKIFKFILFSYDPLEILGVAIGLLYKHVGYGYLQIWMVIAKGLKDCIDGVKDLSLMNMESGSNGYLSICHLLSYPFVVYSCPEQKLSPEEFSVSAQRKLEFEHVIEVWKLLYGAFCASMFKQSTMNSLTEHLCSMLNGYIDQNISMIDCGCGSGTELDLNHNDLDLDFLSLSGNVVTCVLKQIQTLAASSDGNEKKHAGDPSGMKNSLGLVARFLKLSWAKIGANPPSGLLVTSRVLSELTHFVSCLRSRQSILSLIEIINCPLLQWLSHRGIKDLSTNDQLQNLWAEILNCLRRSQPPIVFDSPFLKLQAPLLEKTLDHPKSTISELTINFWNSTYGEQIKLDYPESLVDLLDKLSRNRRINLSKKSLSFLVKCHSIQEVPGKIYKVTATNNRSSKRIELVEHTVNEFENKDKFCSSSKRKRLELTEHQKEVRRAQQGREMACNGHGLGIRTYTNVDFLQGNEYSQEHREIQNPEESREIRNPESILEMLRRVA